MNTSTDSQSFWNFPPLVDQLKPSAIREILKHSTGPGIISFAGGLPAPELFPLEKIRQCSDEVISNHAREALQYSITRGVMPLREQLVEIERHFDVTVSPNEMIVTAGAQQGLDMIVQALTVPGDTILTENPTYIGAIQIFQLHGVSIVPVPTDAEGIIPEALPELITRHKPKLIYLIADFQNPTGISLTESRRHCVLEIAEKFRVPVIDDAPYTEIRFTGKHLPSLTSINPAITIGLRTFSKTIAPGFRVAWLTADAKLVSRLEILKQALDLHASTFGQYVIAKFLGHGWYESHIATIRADYFKKRQHMLAELKSHMPKGVSWTEPEGGLFLWVSLPEGIDATKLLQKAIEEKVAFVPGEPFFADSVRSTEGTHRAPKNVLRLNFSNTTVDGITIGIGRLAKLISSEVSTLASTSVGTAAH